jgi:hypothetical protein
MIQGSESSKVFCDAVERHHQEVKQETMGYHAKLVKEQNERVDVVSDGNDRSSPPRDLELGSDISDLP